jgi:hypothetical protein
MLRKGLRKSAALKFGSLFHRGLNAWWSSKLDRFDAALVAMREHLDGKEETDAFEMVKAETLIAGYTARWSGETLETIAVEKQFRQDIMHDPGYGEPFDIGYAIAGSIDAIVSDASGVHNVEHKTTSQDISAGAAYWSNRVTLDPQVSTYEAAAREMGYDIRDTIYDVIRKPEMQPLKATPEEQRKYTKPTKSEPVPRLYANQRETDESLEEYRDRLTKDIVARPDWYFQRMTIVRLERDTEEHHSDVKQTAAAIRFATENDAWPRSPNACERFRRLCEYHPVCSGQTTIDDGTHFETKSRQHEELNDDA